MTGKPDRLESAVRVELPGEPLNVVRLAREEEGSVLAEKHVLVPTREVHGDGRVAEFDEDSEASELRRDKYSPQRLPDHRRTHRASMPRKPRGSVPDRRLWGVD